MGARPRLRVRGLLRGGVADLAQVHVKLVGRDQVSDGEQLHGNVESRRLRVTKALVAGAKRGGDAVARRDEEV